MADQQQRTADVERTTGETRITVRVDLDGAGRAAIGTGIGFFDHMLDLLARHSLIDLDLSAEGDLEVDAHHTVEDAGIVLGKGLDRALGERAGIRRYGWAAAPMDETLATAAVDLGGRPYLVYDVTFPTERVGEFDTELVREFLLALATHAKMNLHLSVPYGANSHHVSEAVMKALALALRQAVEPDPRRTDVPSTKGSL